MTDIRTLDFVIIINAYILYYNFQVTGSNKGIGFAIVKGLCQEFEGDVILTARNADRGKAALKSLNEVFFIFQLSLLHFSKF